MQNDDLLTAGDVADLFGCTPKTIRAWIKSGKLRASQPGRKLLIQRQDARKLLKQTVVQICICFPVVSILVNTCSDNVSI